MGSIILGVIFAICSLFGITYYWWDVLAVLRGLFPILLLAIGVVAIIAGLEILKEQPENSRIDDEGIK